MVAPLTNANKKYIFLKKVSSEQGFSKFNYDNKGSEIKVVSTETEIGAYSQYSDGQIFYIIDNDNFKILNNNVLFITADYKAQVGRSDLKFQYVHSADEAFVRDDYKGRGRISLSGIALVQVVVWQPPHTQVWII